MTVKEALLREIDSLPDDRQADVLTFVRFLKIGLADPQSLERQFTEALAQAQRQASEKGITEQDIQDEIRAVRAGR